MKKIILSQEPSLSAKIKVRLDHKTMVIIKNLSALAIWKVRYPNAKVVD